MSEPDKSSVAARFRWERWTPPRALAATVWVCGMFIAGGVLFYAAALSIGLSGLDNQNPDAPLTGEMRETMRANAFFIILSGLIIATGPFGVWLFRRKRVWMRWTIGVAIVVCGLGLWGVIDPS